jgi:hypothetical protein
MHPTGWIYIPDITYTAPGGPTIPDSAISTPRCDPVGRTEGRNGPGGTCEYECITDPKIVPLIMREFGIEGDPAQIVAEGMGIFLTTKNGEPVSARIGPCVKPCPPDRGCMTPCWWWAVVGILGGVYLVSRER